jgi:tetratricopeptide (TPR) repeat protein
VHVPTDAGRTALLAQRVLSSLASDSEDSRNVRLTRRTHGVFLSYRRVDSSGYVGRLHARLAKEFRVFLDLDSIPPGTDFAQVINMHLDKSKAALVVIGPQWGNVRNDQAEWRLDDPDDYVRLEITLCLHRNIPVIPILVGNASLPRPESIPTQLAELLKRQAYELGDGRRWDVDVERLVSHLRDIVNPGWRRDRLRLRFAIVVALASLIAFGATQIQRRIASSNRDSAHDVYEKGVRALDQLDGKTAEEHFRHSLRIDNKLILAHSALSEALLFLGNDASAKYEATVAFDNRKNEPEDARLQIEAQYYSLVKDFEKAITTYCTLIDKHPEQINYRLKLASVLQDSGSPDKALEILSKVKVDSENGHRISLKRAEVQKAAGHYAIAATEAKKAAEGAMISGDEILQARALILHCNTVYRVGMQPDDAGWEVAKKSCEQARILGQKNDDKLTEARAINGMANLYYARGAPGDEVRAIDNYEKARELAAAVNDVRDAAGALNNLASIKQDQGDWQGAVEQYKLAYSTFEASNDKAEMANTLSNIAAVLQEQGQMTEAKSQLERANGLAKESRDAIRIAQSTKALADHDLYAGNAFEALTLYQGALVACGSQSKGLASEIQRGIGDTLLAKNDLVGAEQAYQQALQSQVDLGKGANTTRVRLSLVNLHSEAGDTDRAVNESADLVSELDALDDKEGKIIAHLIAARSILFALWTARTDQSARNKSLRDVTSEIHSIGKQDFYSQYTDRETRFLIETAQRQLDFLAGRRQLHGIERLVSETEKLGYLGRSNLEARLAQGEMELRSATTRARGKATLSRLVGDADRRGFTVIAMRAASLSSVQRPKE